LAAFFHAVFEALDRTTEVTAHIAELLGTKDHDHDQQDDQPMPNGKSTHVSVLTFYATLKGVACTNDGDSKVLISPFKV
jgi:hypothetical protein